MARYSFSRIDRISHDEYFNALEKVNRFHLQLKNDELEAKTALKNLKNNRLDASIIDLVQKSSTKRVLNALKIFLDSEITYRKIPFSSAKTVTALFFVERYTLSELKKIRNLVANSIISLSKILLLAGYTLQP